MPAASVRITGSARPISTIEALPFVCATTAMRLGGMSEDGSVGREGEGEGATARVVMGWVKRMLRRVVAVLVFQRRSEPSRELERTVLPIPRMASAVTAFVWPRSVRGLLPS